MPMLEISLFGNFTLRYGEKVICEEKSEKRFRLIKYLVCKKGESVSKRELIDVLFGYGAYLSETSEGLNALNATISRSRKIFDSLGLCGRDIIVCEKDRYRFCFPVDTVVDAEIFSKAPLKVFSANSISERESFAEEAVTLYKGAYLRGECFDESDGFLLQKYHQSYKQIVCFLCKLLRETGRAALAGERAINAIKTDPYCEDFYIERVLSCMALGDTDRARQIYKEASELFESKSSIIVSEKFREIGKSLEENRGIHIVLPEKYSGKAERIKDFIASTVEGNEEIKITLI